LRLSRIKDKKKKFKSYFNELNEKYDKSRLEQEIIYYIEKLDINEEIIRLQHHLKFFSSEMKNKEKLRGRNFHLFLKKSAERLILSAQKLIILRFKVW